MLNFGLHVVVAKTLERYDRKLNFSYFCFKFEVANGVADFQYSKKKKPNIDISNLKNIGSELSSNRSISRIPIH